MYRLVDTHAHLDEIPDLEQAIAQAKQAGVLAIVAVGSDLDSNRKVLELAQTYKGMVYPALGLHPWNLAEDNMDANLKFIESEIGGAAAIGEVGLDYDKKVRTRADKDLQAKALRQVLEIARAHDKPAIIHSRYAWKDTLNLVRESKLEKAGFHWYTGTSSVLREIVSLGYFASATPAVEYHEEHRRAVKEVPLDRLLLETDSPVVYRRGTESEFESRPADVTRVLKGVATLRATDEAQLAETTTNNAVKLFGLQNPG